MCMGCCRTKETSASECIGRKCLQVNRVGGASRNPFFLDRHPITESNKGKRGIGGCTLGCTSGCRLTTSSYTRFRFVQALSGNGLNADVKFVKTASTPRKPKHQ